MGPPLPSPSSTNPGGMRPPVANAFQLADPRPAKGGVRLGEGTVRAFIGYLDPSPAGGLPAPPLLTCTPPPTVGRGLPEESPPTPMEDPTSMC